MSYEIYLKYLQLCNKQKEILQTKSEECIRKEQLEQGFQLYFNIPNKSNSKKQCIKLKSDQPNKPICFGPTENFRQVKSDPNMDITKTKRKTWNDELTNNYCIETENRHVTPVFVRKTQFKKTTLKNSNNNSINNSSSSSSSGSNSSSSSSSNSNSMNKNILNDQREIIKEFQLVFDIHSNWGNKNWIGLNCLEITIDNLNKLLLFPKSIKIYKLSNNLKQMHFKPDNSNFNQLFQNMNKNNKNKNLWISNTKCVPLQICCHFQIESQFVPHKPVVCVNLWNFNDDLQHDYFECGVKMFCLKLIHSDKLYTIFDGILEQGVNRQFKAIINCNLDETNLFSLYKHNKKLQSQIGTTYLENNMESIQDYEYQNVTNCDIFATDNSLSLSDTLTNVIESIETSKSINKNDNSISNLLETSWNSLKFFNRFHAGRISMTHGLEDANILKSNNTILNSIKNLDQLQFENEFDVIEKNNHNRTNNTQSEILEKLFVKSSFFNTNILSNSSQSNFSPESSTCFINNESLKIIKKFKIECPERVDPDKIPIPNLPHGKCLTIDILSTWGDKFYVGLTGIEIFTSDGKYIGPHCQIRADPTDINTLPGYEHDPRVVSNLLDGTNWTNDDIHMWLAPFYSSRRHLIQIQLPIWCTSLAMIRVWNYNKSRVHASRGAKQIIIYLDNNPIFGGKIRKTSGFDLDDSNVTNFSETILFSTDDNILNLIGKNDPILSKDWLSINDNINTILEHSNNNNNNNSDNNNNNNNDQKEHFKNPNNFQRNDIRSFHKTLHRQSPSNQSENVYFIEIHLLQTWNEQAIRIGLTGIELLDSNWNCLKVYKVVSNDIRTDFINKTNKVQGSIEENEQYIGNLFNNCNQTINSQMMWSTTFQISCPFKLKLFIQPKRPVEHVRIWNYNAPGLNLDYGCKMIKFVSNSKIPELTTTLRYAPGHLKYDFVQTISIDQVQMDSMSPNMHKIKSKLLINK